MTPAHLRYDDSVLEATLWPLLADSRRVDDFRDYLRQFRHGRHRHEAVERIVALDESAGGCEKSHYPEVFALLRAHADAGECNAQFHLGKAFSDGIGTAADAAIGEPWYRLAIRQGELRAQINLSMTILELCQTATPERVAEALDLAGRAADAGEARSLYLLAEEKLRQAPGERDVAGAIELLQAAFAAGDTLSALRLARLFRFGDGVRQDNAMADDFTRQAAEVGDSNACYHIGFYTERDSHGPTGAETVRHWYKRGAALLDPDCLRQLGLLCLRGGHLPKDGAAGVSHLKRAAALGDDESMRVLGIT